MTVDGFVGKEEGFGSDNTKKLHFISFYNKIVGRSKTEPWLVLMRPTRKYSKKEKFYCNYLKLKCNTEWTVHNLHTNSIHLLCRRECWQKTIIYKLLHLTSKPLITQERSSKFELVT